MGCTPHMSWSPCVRARVASVCPRHAQGRAMVPPWCGQGFPWCSLLWVTYPLPLPPLKEQYGSFSLFLEETLICLRRHNEIINNYKLKFQVPQLSSAPPKSGAHAMPIWCAHSACLARPLCVLCTSGPLAVRVWLAHGARAMRVWLARSLLT